MTYEQEARGVTPEQRAKIVDIYTHQLANPHGLSMEREKMILDFLNHTPTVYHKQIVDRSMDEAARRDRRLTRVCAWVSLAVSIAAVVIALVK